MKSGIYKILNLQNGKYYIGSAKNLDYRFSRHKFDFYNNCHHNIYLQRAFNLYGANSFEFHILEYCEKEKLIEREQYWIDDLKPAYNILKIAYSRLGSKHTKETKAKMSAKAMGRKNRLGFKTSDVTKALMSKNRKGKSYKRNKIKWPHDLGSRCKCDECRLKWNKYVRDLRKSKRKLKNDPQT